jgi:DNA-binding NarL/FixJ family response regulator
VQLPDMDGFDVAELLAEQAADTAVVMVSTREARDYHTRLARSPAVGFISKADMSAGALAHVLEGSP